MKFQRTFFSILLLLAAAQARIGRQIKGRKGKSGKSDKEEDDAVELVVVFKDDETDAFEDMSTTFANLPDPEAFEVHEMLKNVKMARILAKPAVSLFLRLSFLPMMHF